MQQICLQNYDPVWIMTNVVLFISTNLGLITTNQKTAKKKSVLGILMCILIMCYALRIIRRSACRNDLYALLGILVICWSYSLFERQEVCAKRATICM